MRFDLDHDVNLKFSKLKITFTISQPKVVRLPRNEKQTYGLILGIKCNHWVWPWPWIFKVKFWNSRISGIGGPIDIEQKGVVHDYDHDLLVTKIRSKDLADSDRVTSDVGVPSTRLVGGQVTACCLTAPCHYPKQCGRLIKSALQHSVESNIKKKSLKRACEYDS